MAAYAALVSLLNDLELIPNHPTHSFSFDNQQISSLSQNVHFLVDFMESYDSHGCSREALKVLEARIAFVAHAANDVIGSHLVGQIRAGLTARGKTRTYFLFDLQKAIDHIEFVKRKAMQLQAKKEGLKAEQRTYSVATSSKPLTSSGLMVGFEPDTLRLMEMLIRGSPLQQVIPIVGMGGIGKTTLSRNVYDHLIIHSHFDVRLWATISQKYSIGKILRQLLSKSSDTDVNVTSTSLGVELHKKLCVRRYLIVLDDLWDVEAWDEIRLFFPDNGNGSRVIVTTRLSNLAAGGLDSFRPFEMKFLDEDKSWELFSRMAFGEEEDCPVELEEIGKRIVRRCRGLPLSIVVMGGHLRRSSKAIEYWEKLSNSMNPISSLGEEEQCLEIIGLSYLNLPAWLRPCFLYMGVYPEDYLIDVYELVRFWVSEGFLKPKKGLILEEVAEDFVEDLIDRNLILVSRRRWNGKAEVCGVHDIVRELCLKVAKDEKFIGVAEDTTQAIGYKEAIYFPVSDSQQLNSRYIAMHVPSDELPYLIPSSLSLFWNMQTLIVESDFGGEIRVPYEIWEMTQLRHMQFDRACLPHPLLCDVSYQEECNVLGNLHTLSGVVNLRLTEEVCKRMPNLKKLTLSYYYLPGDCKEACSYYCLHNLGRFIKLKSLQCSFGLESVWRDVFLSCTFPSSLEELSLNDCHWEDLTKMIKSTPHLGSLELQFVSGSMWDLAGEEFPHLKILKISFPHHLIYWNANSSNFPVLEKLHIFYWRGSELSEIPFDFGEIPTLRLIELKGCDMSCALSAMRIVAEQENLGNEDLQVIVRYEEMEGVERFKKMVQEEGVISRGLCLYYRYHKIKVW